MTQISYATAEVGSIGRGEEGTVRVGIFSSLASGFLAELLHVFCAKHSEVRTDIIEDALSDHIAAVRQYRLDVAFVIDVPCLNDCDVKQFWTERVCAVLPKIHPLAARKSIHWTDLRDQRFVVSKMDPGPEIHGFLVKHLADLDVHPTIEYCAVGRDNLMQIVSLGRGLTLTSEATIATRFPGVVYKHLRGELLPFSAVWSPRNDNPAFRRLLSLAHVMSAQSTVRPLPRKADTSRPDVPFEKRHVAL